MTDEHKQVYAGMFILKMLDLDEKSGGVEIPVLGPRVAPIEAVLERLMLEGHIEIDRKRQRYRLTEAGLEYLRTLIDEAEYYIEEFDEFELSELVPILEGRNLDSMRVRFLWGWYQGEFDDVALFQRQRGFAEVEPEWESFVVSDAFYEDLARDLGR